MNDSNVIVGSDSFWIVNGTRGQIEKIYVEELGSVVVRMRMDDNTFKRFSIGNISEFMEKVGVKSA